MFIPTYYYILASDTIVRMNLITSYNPKHELRDMNLQFRALPKEPYPWVETFYIVVDRCPPSRISETYRISERDSYRRGVERVAKFLRPLWPVKVIETPPAESWMPSYLHKYVDEDIGFKVLIPFMVPAPFIWIDGDVIPVEDMSHLVDEKRMWGSRMGHDKWITEGSKKKGDIRPSTQALAIEREFGFLPEVYMDAAVFHLPKVNQVMYSAALIRFFNIHEIAVSEHKPWHDFRKGDQKFLSTWMQAPTYITDLMTGTLEVNTDRCGRFVQGGTEATTWRVRETIAMDPTDPLYFAYNDVNWKDYCDRERFKPITLLHYSVSTHKEAAISKFTSWLAPEEGFLPERLPAKSRRNHQHSGPHAL